MPKRIVDGDALWRSDKLAQVEPPWIRAEFANLIPLALANGSFECNKRLIYSRVYCYNRPDITLEKVEEILNEFERVGMLIRWPDVNGKVWGYFPGIDKPGRLPSTSRQKKKHEAIGPTPPTNGKPMASHTLPNGEVGFGSGSGIGKGIGQGLGCEDNNKDNSKSNSNDAPISKNPESKSTTKAKAKPTSTPKRIEVPDQDPQTVRRLAELRAQAEELRKRGIQ